MKARTPLRRGSGSLNLQMAQAAVDHNWTRYFALQERQHGTSRSDELAGRGVVRDAPADPRRRRAVAYHEAGHMVGGVLLYGLGAVGAMKFTHGGAGGIAHVVDPPTATRHQRLVVSACGPAAELLGRMVYSFGGPIERIADEAQGRDGVIDPTPEELAIARWDAGELLRSPCHTELVGHLADRFYGVEELSRAEVLAFFDQHRYFL